MRLWSLCAPSALHCGGRTGSAAPSGTCHGLRLGSELAGEYVRLGDYVRLTFQNSTKPNGTSVSCFL